MKLPDERLDGVPQNEYSVMRWAGDAGIAVPEILLLEVGQVEGLPTRFYEAGGMAFAVRRFDRVGGQRVHIEDFAQVLSLKPREKYGHANFESIARVLAAVSPEDVDEMVRRLAFQVLAGNGDAHVKNWSLAYPDGVHARLSPAYDLVNTTSYVANDDLGLKLGDTKAFDEISVHTFRRFATRAGLDADHVAALVRAQVEATKQAWENVRSDVEASDEVREEIERRLTELPLASS